MAIITIRDILDKNLFSNEIIALNIKKLNKIDHNFYRQLVYGVIENLYYLDYIIGKISSVKLKKIDKNILNILRLGIYELRFLNNENYASINEAVKLSKKFNYKSKNFVNAILRNFDRDIENLSIVNIKDIDERYSIQYSINIELIRYIKKYYDNYLEIIESFNKVPSFSLRVNTMLTSKEDLREILKLKGYIVDESKISKDSLIVENPSNMTDLEEFKNGLFTIQDQASILVSEILNPSENSNVLDLCAAPGSKSTHLLQIMNDKGLIYSNDISKNKLNKIKENFDRLKFKNYKIINFDATQVIENFEEKFDYILVDAPCSGIGVIKRKPEIKLKKTMDEINSLSLIQSSILSNAYKYLKKGGFIVYSTCTIGNVENLDIIDKFLNENNDMKIVEINGKNYIQLLPDTDNDGFFICKIAKR
ncbi:16S rRNA (cytosine(967)-C(5))-methyltransferase RsmB [Helcococcus ovis]|uniref:16S rRNA (cytosine(967)-C(5))-methyltransferase n=7 Tax=Peptoniphilaceae TaxID=1570339 RepID=A0A4R9C3Y4_9FIRM|nr:16S rRNA (cytosine(967)-C(5))-methyltransferase RsmB [Helcococcus ovis]TFF67182.1 16S rRNA (cytosine(967)-C(5))-methyltransferase RsmB [Helcococcus ovis]